MVLPPSVVIAIPIIIRIVRSLTRAAAATTTTCACMACWERENILASSILEHDGAVRGRFRFSTREIDLQLARHSIRALCRGTVSHRQSGPFWSIGPPTWRLRIIGVNAQNEALLQPTTSFRLDGHARDDTIRVVGALRLRWGANGQIVGIPIFISRVVAFSRQSRKIQVIVFARRPGGSHAARHGQRSKNRQGRREQCSHDSTTKTT